MLAVSRASVTCWAAVTHVLVADSFLTNALSGPGSDAEFWLAQLSREEWGLSSVC